jgi:hypothetical protein
MLKRPLTSPGILSNLPQSWQHGGNGDSDISALLTHADNIHRRRALRGGRVGRLWTVAASDVVTALEYGGLVFKTIAIDYSPIPPR